MEQTATERNTQAAAAHLQRLRDQQRLGHLDQRQTRRLMAEIEDAMAALWECERRDARRAAPAAVTPAEVEEILRSDCDYCASDIMESPADFWRNPRQWAEDIVTMAFNAVADAAAAPGALVAAWDHFLDSDPRVWEQSTEREQAVRFCVQYLAANIDREETVV